MFWGNQRSNFIFVNTATYLNHVFPSCAAVRMCGDGALFQWNEREEAAGQFLEGSFINKHHAVLLPGIC